MRIHLSNRYKNYEERKDMEGADQSENNAIAEAMVKQVANNEAEDYAAHSPAESHQSRDRADELAWEQVCRKNHDEC